MDSEKEEKDLKDNESDEEAPDMSEKPNSSRYEKKFNIRWLNDYSWLKHDSEKGMLCKMCIRFGKQSSFTTGCTNFRTSLLTRHTESTEHRNALLASNMHPCPIHPTRVDSSEALYDSNRFARSRSATPEVNIREITIQEPSSFLKRGNKLQSIRLRHVTIRLDSHAVDPQYRKSTSVK